MRRKVCNLDDERILRLYEDDILTLAADMARTSRGSKAGNETLLGFRRAEVELEACERAGKLC